MRRVAWAQEQGIDARSLNAWRLNLERARLGASPAPRLVELVATTPREPMTYRVRCGVFVVEVEGEIETERLGLLLRVVASSC